MSFGGGSVNVNEQSHMTTVGSSLDESSTSSASLKAQLSGDVRVNFKSDFLPVEQLATPTMIAAIQGHAAPQEPPRLAASDGGAAADGDNQSGANNSSGG